MQKVYIVAAKRSAFGKYLGTLANTKAVDLAVLIAKEVIKESKIDPKNIDETIIGMVGQAGQKGNIARQISIKSGIPVEVPAYTINMLCASGMKSIMEGYKSIKIGDANVILTGGTETMSSSPLIIPGKIKQGIKMGGFKAVDHVLHDGLIDAFNNYHMGITAENIAKKYRISRSEQDELALVAHHNAERAIKDGTIAEEIIPIEIPTRKEVKIFKTNEHYRPGMTINDLAKLAPAFVPGGTVTAGNASGMNDGASIVMLASEKAVKEYGLTPLAEIISTGQGAVDPSIMGMGPVPAVENAFKKIELELKDMDYCEFNEAFAAQAIGVYKELEKRTGLKREWFYERCNKNGSAISLGHPVSATGPRISMHAMYEMKRKGLTHSLATMCIGGGQGACIIMKNV